MIDLLHDRGIAGATAFLGVDGDGHDCGFGPVVARQGDVCMMCGHDVAVSDA